MKYGPVFRLKLLNVPVVIVSDLAVLRPLLQRQEGSLFQVPFSAFERLMEDMDNIQVYDVHNAWVSRSGCSCVHGALLAVVPKPQNRWWVVATTLPV